MQPWPPHLYCEEGAALGRSADLVGRSLLQAHSSQRGRDLPAILTLNHLATMTNVPYEFLRGVVSRTRPNTYRSFRIRKRSGGYRTICVPSPMLMRVQRWLATNVLNSALVHSTCHAYAPGSRLEECARIHCGSRWLIKLDLQQFFESISERRVYHVFRELGYGALVAFELARICTRVLSGESKKYKLGRWLNEAGAVATISSYQSVRIGHLPQGAPTSPMLSNLAMKRFDRQMHELAIHNKMALTRYADDLTFSTADKRFTRMHAVALARRARAIILKEGLRPRATKTKIIPPGARKIVLGLVVDGARPRLSREFRRKLEAHVFHLSTKGPIAHAAARGFKSIYAMREHIEGLLCFAKTIDNEFAAPLYHDFRGIEWPI
jgi:RNA-directed DNA polymerase